MMNCLGCKSLGDMILNLFEALIQQNLLVTYIGEKRVYTGHITVHTEHLILSMSYNCGSQVKRQ